MNLFRVYFWDKDGSEEQEEVFPALDMAGALDAGEDHARELGEAWQVVRVEYEDYESAWLQRVHTFGPKDV